MFRTLAFVASLTVLGGCFLAPPETMAPYLGAWDCGANQLEITETTYRYGTDQATLRQVEDRMTYGSYTLLLQGGRQIQVTRVFPTSLLLLNDDGTWAECGRVG